MNISMERLFQNNPIFDEGMIKNNEQVFEYIRGLVGGSMVKDSFNPYKRVAELCGVPERETMDFDPKRVEALSRSTMAREVLVWYFSWAIPNDEAIEELVKHSPILEIGAGRGYWASLVKKGGGKVICFDNGCDNPNRTLNWHPVAQIEFKDMKYFSVWDRTLFLCWPPYDNPLAYNSLKVYEGKKFIYIGEGHGGCTGDDHFHNLLEKEWTEVKVINIPQWWGIHDVMVVYERN